MRAVLRGIGRAAAKTLLGWAVFALVVASLGYFFVDRGRSFMSLLPARTVCWIGNHGPDAAERRDRWVRARLSRLGSGVG